ncbi:outer membrane beta-barrel protein [Taibaiella koreensis]|uniref:outer membrane beta-barrel protein n=1 Tax=Taibaiella koreensis TaxID=1268548 RepID=UPI000E5993AE|nr:outer membrane beta-barrel protein [Taibaiella koreensis]
MKFLKSTVAAALFCCALLPATQTQAQKLLLGLKAGVNLDRTGGDHLDGKFAGSFLGGAFVGVKMTKIKVQGELLFSQGKVTTGNNFGDAFKTYLKDGVSSAKEGTFKMNELSIPVTVGFNLLPKLLWIHAGPQYTAVASIKDVDGLVKATKDVFKSGYLSGVVGAELELPFSLNAGIRYIFGISDRNNTNVSDSWRTSHFQIHVGFNIL